MKTLIEDYERRLVTITEMIDLTSDSGSQNDIAKMARLKAKQSEYQTIIIELERAQRRVDEEIQEEQDKIGLLARLYYRYKKTSDSEILDYLERIKIVKREIHAGGMVTKYYPLKASNIKKIKERPRNISLTFDAAEITQKAVTGLEEYKRVRYLCKSTSRFFLKPDIGEIFDAIDFHDLICGNKFDAICFLDGYETLPNTDGEHHIMTALLLVNTKERQKEAIDKLHQL